jgi:hypothetical protein
MSNSAEEKYKAIQIWPWNDAPDFYKSFSECGGDEDYVAYIPERQTHSIPYFLQEGMFGNNVDRYKLADGSMVLISSHA